MKKVLIITYYWPPSGGAGVQRWLKFVKYLREFGWEPVVYTPENPEPPDIDEPSLAEVPENLTVIKKPVWEPYNIYKLLTGKKSSARVSHGFLKEDKSTGFAEKLSVWIRGNFFIPDARCFWIRPSAKFLNRFLRTNPVDAIVSSGPPHSMHLIAMGLKQKLNIPWLADFRDPWTEIDYYDQLKLNHFADQRHKKLEKQVLKSADIVVAVGSHLAGRLEEISQRKVEVITNGFDEDDFNFLPVEPDRFFTITHIGSLNKDRNAPALWHAIAGLCSENDEINRMLRLRFVGRTDHSLRDDLAKSGLLDRTEFISYLPHQEALKIAASSAVLLLLINQTPNQQGIVTGKIFEYMATGRPVFCIGPGEGESARMLLKTNAGVNCEFTDKDCMKSRIAECFQLWSSNKLIISAKDIQKYNRKDLTLSLANLLDRLTV